MALIILDEHSSKVWRGHVQLVLEHVMKNIDKPSIFYDKLEQPYYNKYLQFYELLPEEKEVFRDLVGRLHKQWQINLQENVDDMKMKDIQEHIVESLSDLLGLINDIAPKSDGTVK